MINLKNPWKRNLAVIYANGGLMWGRFTIPVLALFYIASQVPLEQFAIIMSVFALTTLLLEIPTGVLADLLGKKKTLLIGRAMYIIEIALFAFFNGFWIFLIAKIISGIGVSLSSGTEGALLYDTLKRLGIEKEHKRIRGILNVVSGISMAIVFGVGAYLFTIHYKLPAIASLPLLVIGFLLTFLLKEPYENKKKLNLSNSWRHLKQGIRYFVKQKYLIYLASFTLLAGSAISMVLSLSSSYLEKIMVPISFMGIISFISYLLYSYSSKMAYKWEAFFGEKKSLLLIKFVIVVSIIAMSLIIPYYGLIFLILISFIQGFYEVILSDYTNRHVKSSHRATMLSINNMFDNIGIFILFPVLGWMIKEYSIARMHLLFGIFLAVAFTISFFFYLGLRRKDKKN